MTTAASAGATPARLYKRRLSLLVVAHVANDAYFGFLPPLLPLLVERLDLPLSLVGLLATTLSVTGAMGQPVFGYFADRLRQGWLLALGPLGGAFMAFMVYMPGFWTLFLLLLVAGAGSACFHPVASVIASQSSGPRKGLGMSVYIAGGRLGMALGAGMATLIVTRWGIEGVPYAALFGLVVGVPLLFAAPPFGGSASAAPMGFRTTLRSLRAVFRPLLLLWVVNLARTAVTMAVHTFIPLYIVAGGGTVGAGGWAVSLFLLAAAAGGVYGGHLSDRFGRRGVTIGALLLGTPTLAVAFMVGEPLRTLFLMASGAAYYSQMGVSVTYAQEIAPAHAALVSGFMLGVMWFVASVSMIGVGALADLVGLATALPVFCLSVGGAGLLLSFGLPRLKND